MVQLAADGGTTHEIRAVTMSYYIKKIIVPVDLSETSLNALDVAVALAKKHKAFIYVLNVIEPNFGIFSEDYDSSFSHGKMNTKDVLDALINSIVHVHGVEPKLIQEEGHVVDQVIKLTFLEQCDLIVMGTHGASGFREGFVGSNTYSVIKHSNCPVLSIPTKKKYSTFKKILFPIRPVTGALSKYDIVSPFLNKQSNIEVLGLSYKQIEKETNVLDKIVEEVKDSIDKDKIYVNTAWGSGNNISEDILNYSQQNLFDLIVSTPILDITSKSGFIGPHAQKIINSARVPILTIKAIGVPAYA